MWVPIGAIAGGLGATGGSAFAAVATPTAEDGDVEPVSEWCRAAFAAPLLHGRLTTPVLSVAGATALSATVSGVVAWSVNEYPHKYRARVLGLVDGSLLLLFLVRHSFKVWRAGGRAAGGRLRIMVRKGCGCRGCVWPALL